MKFSPNSRISFAVGAFLLAGSFTLAQARSAARNRQSQSGSAIGTTAQGIAVDHAGGNGVRRADTGKSGVNPLYEEKGQANLNPNAGVQGTDASQSQSTPKKHIAGVKYEDRVAGNSPEGTAGHATNDVVQRKDGSIVHSDFPKSADRNSAHATESLRTSSDAKVGENPLYKDSGNSGTNPMYESDKQQSVAPPGTPSPSGEAQRPKPRKVRFSIGGVPIFKGNSTPGMAVNEQGSSKATAIRRH
jgi:hypothetical protein